MIDNGTEWIICCGPDEVDESGSLADVKPIHWLVRSSSNSSNVNGWKVYSNTNQANRQWKNRWCKQELDRAITVFDDGTWEYGVL